MYKVDDLMRRHPETVACDASPATCAGVMARSGVRHLPVVDGMGRLRGLVTDVSLLSIERNFDPQRCIPQPGADMGQVGTALGLCEDAEVICAPEDLLVPVLRRLARSRQDAAVVVDAAGRPVGLLAAHELVSVAADLLDDRPLPRRGPDSLVRVAPGQTRAAARVILGVARVDHLLVMEGQDLRGVLSVRDVFRRGRPRIYIPDGRRDRRRHVRVKDLLAHPPEQIAADRSLRQAASQMAERMVGCLPAIEASGDVISMITRRDVLIGLADQVEQLAILRPGRV